MIPSSKPVVDKAKSYSLSWRAISEFSTIADKSVCLGNKEARSELTHISALLKGDFIRISNNEPVRSYNLDDYSKLGHVSILLIASFASHLSCVVIRHYLTFLRLLSGTLRMMCLAANPKKY